MKKYISLLRGINVSGQKRILMNDLKSLYESIGLDGVSTYIQSGNVVFNSDEKNKNKIAELITDSIKLKYGFDVKVLIRTKNELAKITKQNPFLKNEGVDVKRLYVTFLERKPDAKLINNLATDKETIDSYKVIGMEVYLHVPGGFGRTIYSNNYIEKKLALKATTRNWKTVNKLLQIASE